MKLIFYVIFIYQINTQVIFNFKKKNYTQNLNQTIIEFLFNNQLETEINIGTPYQKIPLLIQQKTFCLYITSAKCEGNIIKFNQNSSSSFKSIQNKLIQYYYQDFTFVIKSFDNLNNNNLKFEKINFFLISQYKFNISGVLGLRIFNDEKDYNLIYQLKKKKIINSYNFYIKYTNENEGKLFIGNLFNEKVKYVKEILDIQNRFGIIFDNISSGDNEIYCYSKAFFQIENRFIRGDNQYKIDVQKHFFKDYIIQNKCHSDYFINKWEEMNIYFYCDDDIDLDKFKTLKFFIKDVNLTFEFNSKDLFYKFGNQIYFLVYFTDKINVDWILGEPFLKKYLIGFDQDKKIILFLNDNFEKNNNKNYIYISLIIIFILIFVFSNIYFCKLLKIKKLQNEKELNEKYYSIN